jgi:UDP-3-O-[3-hydroxymyristoyl] N-acetylglucosamine deacetylase
MKQRTLEREIVLEGVGIHSGERSRVILHPEPENHGIYFYRHGIRIPLSPEFVVNTFHSTDLGLDGVRVRTVEHLLSVLHLLRITNLTVEVQGGEEIPIMDGSGYEFYKRLKTALMEQDEEVIPFRLPEEEEVVVEMNGSRLIARSCPCFEITYEGEFPKFLGSRKFTFRGNAMEIVLARTFCFDHEIEYIRKKGLGKGGTLENTVVIGKEKVYNRGGLRYQDEPIRHKVLDLIGDLYLLGVPFKGKVISYRGGHFINYRLVLELHKKYAPEGGVVSG